MSRLQQDQEFSIPGFPGRDFAKSRDPGIFRDGISLKFLSRDFTKKVWVWANLTNYMSPDGEFRCCHLVFGVFCPQIHVFWGPMGKKLQISENEDYIRYVVLIFGNSWTWWEHVHWERKTACISHFWIFVKTQKNGPFLQPKKCFWVVFFCFPARNLYWQKNALDLVNLGP